MQHQSSFNILITLLVARGAVSTTDIGAISKTHGTAATASIYAPTTTWVDTTTATGDSPVASGTLSTDAIAILSSMQAAFATMRAQLTESKATLTDQIRQLATNQAFDANLMYDEISEIFVSLANTRTEQAKSNADLHTQMNELSVNQERDANNLYAELAETRYNNEHLWTEYEMLDFEQVDNSGDFYDKVPMPNRKETPQDEWSVSKFVMAAKLVIADLSNYDGGSIYMLHRGHKN